MVGLHGTQRLDRQDFVEARGEIKSNPALIVGEMTGLTSGFIGSRGQIARENATIVEAFTKEDVLFAIYYREIDNIQRVVHMPFNIVNAIEVALTDTMWRAFLGTFS